jgi:protein-S-isoprenylcysteine O-methyltransferase Ste14
MRLSSERKGWLWVLLQLLLLLLWGLLLVVGDPLLIGEPSRSMIRWIGSVVLAAGIVLAVSGVRGLRRNLTPSPEPRRSGELVTSGIYGRVRHPIYGGVILMVLGASLTLPVSASLAMVPVILLFFHLKSGYEEGRLGERFPRYRDYALRTKRFLPWIW